ncbi:MAG: hypothetical protein IPL27_27860 [Lewinellaceae bacterium]|nr:hypothetical protein [Lewinellaceae bacterium]
MNPGAELQYELGRAVGTLQRRSASTSDTTRKEGPEQDNSAPRQAAVAALDRADLFTCRCQDLAEASTHWTTP